MVNVPRAPVFSNPRTQSGDFGWAWSTPIALYQQSAAPSNVVPRSPHFSNPRTPSWDVGWVWSTPAAYYPSTTVTTNIVPRSPHFSNPRSASWDVGWVWSTPAAYFKPPAPPFSQLDWPLPTLNPYGNVTIYTVVGPNNPNIYPPPPPPTVKIEWIIRARRRGRR